MTISSCRILGLLACFNTLDALPLDDLHSGYDHFPVAVSCYPVQLDRQSVVRPRINWQALDSLGGRAAAVNAWATMPPVPWDVDATTHVDVIHKHLQSCLLRDLPPASAAARNPMFTAATLALVRERRHWRRCERSTRARFLREVARRCFSHWASACSPRDLADDGSVSRCGLLCRRWFRGILLCNPGIARAMSQDKASFFRRMAEQARSAGPSQWAHLMRAITRQGRRFRAPQVLPVLQTETGPVTGRQELQDALGAYFAGAERAHPVSQDQLLSHFRPREPLPVPLTAAHMPSVPALASGFAQLQSKRAPGLSGLMPDLFKINPMMTAVTFWPVVAKTMARGHVPSQWAGGLLSTVPKVGKSAEKAEGWRSILLLEADAKAFQKTIRPDLVATALRARAPFQYGGLPKLSLTLPSSLARAHLAWLNHSRLSGGLVFVDVKSAYYSVIRDVLSATPEQRANVHFAEARARFLFQDPDLQRQFVEKFAVDDPLVAFGASPATIRYVQAHLGQTWYVTRRDAPQAYLTTTGTAPGSPVADILFSLVFRNFLVGVQTHLAQQGLTAHINLPLLPGEEPPASAPGLPAWADDACVMFQVPKAVQVPAAIAGIAEAICVHMRPLCLEPNFGAGKTEVIAVFNGAASRKVRKEHLLHTVPTIPFRCPDGSQGSIRVVPQYRHLGALLRADLNEMPNLRMRAKTMWTMFHPLRKKLLTCPDLLFEEKTHLLRERVIPRFYYQAGLWRLSTRQERLAALEPVRKLLRSALKPITGISSRGHSNEQVAALLCVPLAEEMLDTERCRALLELACLGPPFVCVMMVSGSLRRNSRLPTFLPTVQFVFRETLLLSGTCCEATLCYTGRPYELPVKGTCKPALPHASHWPISSVYTRSLLWSIVWLYPTLKMT